MTDLERLLKGLVTAPACLVSVESTQGSAPREAGAWMAVFSDELIGTIGGGHLEHQAIAEARRQLRGAPGVARQRFALGPALGQCCGGVVNLGFERLTGAEAAGLAERLSLHLHPVALFGGGHVGHALVRALAPLPFAVRWIDSRDGIFPAELAQSIVCEHSNPVHRAVPGLLPNTRVLIMSFSHAEDLDVVGACLRRQREHADLPYIGMIGSKTKWASFANRLQGRGFTQAELAQVVCPIGIPGIEGKQPAVIATAVAAQLLQTLA